MPKIDAVLFDLDGTLLDTALDFTDVVNQLLQEENRATMDYCQVRSAVSHGSVGLIETAFQLSTDDPAFNPLRQRLLDLYINCLTNKTRLFPGLEKLLSRLAKGSIPWGIVTNKPVLYTTPIVEGLQLKPAAVICPDHVTHTKPHPESVHLACQQIGCCAENTVMVGDHLRDVEAGRNAGAISIAAAYGYLNQNEDASDWQADYIAHHSEDLLPILEPLL
ncbi:HAD-IA family hydrolase [Porticoccus sp. W117]|uniref:HAD family hydrolase n=1 Tax=Porticoccus sp. W117 TaxID=3054777 RepID=UPI0025948F6D|nr:HAD-IA family hydrolase [Porticoccus sp. W117]MDM3872093.1 HAD-IA family hydrolase [Porticoccus sp. W117]